MLVGGDHVDALSLVVHRIRPTTAGKALVERLRKKIPRQIYDVAIQASSVTDHRARDGEGAAQGRDREVLRRRHHPQAKAAREAEEGQEAMKQVGSVEVPQEAFLAVLKLDGRSRGAGPATAARAPSWLLRLAAGARTAAVQTSVGARHTHGDQPRAAFGVGRLVVIGQDGGPTVCAAG